MVTAVPAAGTESDTVTFSEDDAGAAATTIGVVRGAEEDEEEEDVAAAPLAEPVLLAPPPTTTTAGAVASAGGATAAATRMVGTLTWTGSSFVHGFSGAACLLSSLGATSSEALRAAAPRFFGEGCCASGAAGSGAVAAAFFALETLLAGLASATPVSQTMADWSVLQWRRASSTRASENPRSKRATAISMSRPSMAISYHCKWDDKRGVCRRATALWQLRRV
mmetsp:Transcript_79816/g.258625  ORF Transcript_79816/g.258625 Transcript_79816/m.258625 type:complete len:223 (+) Transcript_79816:1382-2050(+)